MDVREQRWTNRAGWLWLTLLGPTVGGIAAALSPFAIGHSPWLSRLGYLIVVAVVWLAPLTLMWPYDRD